MKWIKLGTWLEFIIELVTMGTGIIVASWIAKLLGYKTCGCCERKQWLNRLTDKDYDGQCDRIKL